MIATIGREFASSVLVAMPTRARTVSGVGLPTVHWEVLGHPFRATDRGGMATENVRKRPENLPLVPH
jgi:hypothetical protein